MCSLVKAYTLAFRTDIIYKKVVRLLKILLVVREAQLNRRKELIYFL